MGRVLGGGVRRGQVMMLCYICEMGTRLWGG